MILRFGAVAILVATIVILAVLPFATSFVEQWTRRDVELRSRLIFNSTRDQVAAILASDNPRPLSDLFERVSTDERLLGMAFCDADGRLQSPSSRMPSSFSCEKAARGETESYSMITSDRQDILIGTFPLSVNGRTGHLVVLHDLAYADRRGAEARNYFFLALGGVAFGAAALAAIIAALMMRRWVASVRQAIESARIGAVAAPAQENMIPIAQEIHDALQELESSRRVIDAAQTDWTSETLRAALSNELSGSEIIVVSNREPYIHNKTEAGTALQIPASGLVAALEPVTRACGGTWIARCGGTATWRTRKRPSRRSRPLAKRGDERAMLMKNKLMVVAAGAALAFATAVPVVAHHAFGAEFDANRPVLLKGKIVKVELVNPHAWIHVEVAKEGGGTEVWMVEGGTPNTLLRRGITKNTLTIGTEVVVDGYQSKDRSTRANGRDITFADGKKLFMGSSGTGAPRDGRDPTEPPK